MTCKRHLAALAGASDRVPGDRFIDSIDQSSFLIADDGASRRQIWPRMSPFQGTIQPSLYGGKVFNLLLDAKEEHAMLPVKQPYSAVILGTVNRHPGTFKAYPPAVPMQ